jgi:murein DD-endopeptidase MepM/ murein hydrolase activator NlpD
MVNARTLGLLIISGSSLAACGTSGFDEMREASRVRATQVAPPKSQAVPNQIAQNPEAPVTEIITSAVAAPNEIKSEPLSPTKMVSSAKTVSSAVPQEKLVRAGGQTITVSKLETLFAISRRTGVSVRDIAAANNLQEPYAMSPGRVLKVPAVRYYVVSPGETALAISRQTGVAVTQLASLNNLDETRSVKLGQRLRLPLDVIFPKTDEDRMADEKPVISMASKPMEPKQEKPAPDAKTEVATTETQSDRAEDEKPKYNRPRFSWPLEGRIISGFGSKPNGQFNDGINIASRAGQTVVAAADGEVVYADSKLKGFGNLLLIRHSNGWLTAYAHAETLLVRKGMKVSRGEAIARAGASGAVKTPQLHFEVRYNRKPQDPTRTLPDRSMLLTRSETAVEPQL